MLDGGLSRYDDLLGMKDGSGCFEETKSTEYQFLGKSDVKLKGVSELQRTLNVTAVKGISLNSSDDSG